jgi:conjugal transfer pilus assembly protein TraW
MQQNGEMDKLKEKFIRDVKAHAIRPAPVKGLTTTQMPQTLYYDPTYTAKEDITDGKGRVIIKAGTKANALDTVSLRSALLFFNADDPRQINWVKQEIKKHNLVKIILVQGNIKKTSELLKERIYFDQAGTISHKLEIKHIPCVVTQAGQRLEIKEVNINDFEHETNIKSTI